MREHKSTTGASVRPNGTSDGITGPMRSWLRRRMLRTAFIGLYLTGLTAAGFQNSNVSAQPQRAYTFEASIIVPGTPSLNADPTSVFDSVASLPSCDASTGGDRASSSPAAAVNEAAEPAPMVVHSGADMYEVDEVRQEPIPFTKVIQMSRSVSAGEADVVTWGQTGILAKTYRVTYRADQAIDFELVQTRVIKPAINTEVLAGYTDRNARALPSRAGIYTRTREIDMIATGYSPYEGSGRGICATGIRAGFGVVAVDPSVIPLGSKLYIDGYGYALAGDTGGAIRGNRIDLGLNTHHEANLVGRRPVHVYVLSEGR